MATLDITNNASTNAEEFTKTITLSKRTNNNIRLTTANKYVDKDIALTVNVREAVGTIGGTPTAGKATAAITNVNNIATVSSPTGTAGTDYWQIKATATGTNGAYTPKYTISTSGWINSTVTATSAQTVNVSSDTTGKSIYIPKAVGAISLTPGEGSCILSSSTNVITSDSDTSGIAVTFTGGGNVSATAKIITAGYTPINNSFAIGNSTASNTEDLTKYITGVTLTKGKTFSITVPNGALNSDGTNNDTVTFVFTVANDNTGNVTIIGPD